MVITTSLPLRDPKGIVRGSLLWKDKAEATRDGMDISGTGGRLLLLLHLLFKALLWAWVGLFLHSLGTSGCGAQSSCRSRNGAGS